MARSNWVLVGLMVLAIVWAPSARAGIAPLVVADQRHLVPAAMAQPSSTPKLSVETGVGMPPVTNETRSVDRVLFGLVPFDGVAETSVSGIFDLRKETGRPSGDMAVLVPTSSIAGGIAVSASAGAWISSTPSAPWNAGMSSVEVDSGQPVYVFATKVGVHSVTFRAGGVTATVKYRAATDPSAAYNIALSGPGKTIDWPDYFDMTLLLTDMFGNPVPGVEGINSVQVTTSDAVGTPDCWLLDESVTVDRRGRATIELHVCGLRGENHVEIVEAFNRSRIGVKLDSDFSGLGARISEVTAGGPADSAGQRVGDIIANMDGEPIDDWEGFAAVRGSRAPGTSIVLAVVRDGQALEVSLTLGATQSAPAWAPGYVPPPAMDPPRRLSRVLLPVGSTAPLPPQSVVAVKVPGGVEVSWESPADDGASEIQRYVVRAEPGGQSCIAKPGQRSCLITGLVVGSQVSFSVVAINNYGESSPSNAVTMLYVLTAPSPPRQVQVSPGDAEVAVSWSEPLETGGLAISSYTVTASPSGASCTVRSGLALLCSVSGLKNGTAYTFSVVATNAQGDSDPSGGSVSTVPGAVPSPPVNVKIGPERKFVMRGQMWVQVSVEWSRPKDAGDAGISQYRVSSLLHGCQTKQTSCSVLLIADSTDKVTVVAENRFGQSQPSETIKVRTPQYRVSLAGSGPSLVTASSLGASPWFYLTWNVYDPAHSINEFDVDWDLSGDATDTLPARVRRTKDGWSTTIGVSYYRVDRGLCYSLRSGVRDSAALNIDWVGVALPGIDTSNREARIGWTVRCSDW